MSTEFKLLMTSFLCAALCGCGTDNGWADGMALPQRGSGFTTVTDTYGAAVVKPGEFEAESTTKPWSSWWYPVTDTYLFQGINGQLSPLEKYDRFSSSHATDYEKNKIYDPNAANWEGLCNAWAAASVLAPEPKHSAAVGDTTYTVGDLKALLIKSYEFVDGLKQYGQRYDGDASSVFEDIYAEQFHRFLQVQLFEHQRPFIMDKDPGVPVWNTPVWKASVKITREPGDPNLMHADTWVMTASPFVTSYDYVGTLQVAIEYTYDLYGIPRGDGSMEVLFGKWTGESIQDHPDFVTELPVKPPGHHSNNPEIKTDTVNTILKAAGVL